MFSVRVILHLNPINLCGLVTWIINRINRINRHSNIITCISLVLLHYYILHFVQIQCTLRHVLTSSNLFSIRSISGLSQHALWCPGCPFFMPHWLDHKNRQSVIHYMNCFALLVLSGNVNITTGVTVWKSTRNQFLDDSNQEVDQIGRQSTLHWIRMIQRGRGGSLDEYFLFITSI